MIRLQRKQYILIWSKDDLMSFWIFFKSTSCWVFSLGGLVVFPWRGFLLAPLLLSPTSSSAAGVCIVATAESRALLTALFAVLPVTDPDALVLVPDFVASLPEAQQLGILKLSRKKKWGIVWCQILATKTDNYQDRNHRSMQLHVHVHAHTNRSITTEYFLTGMSVEIHIVYI